MAPSGSCNTDDNRRSGELSGWSYGISVYTLYNVQSGVLNVYWGQKPAKIQSCTFEKNSTSLESRRLRHHDGIVFERVCCVLELLSVEDAAEESKK